jgi:hypothetical protein
METGKHDLNKTCNDLIVNGIPVLIRENRSTIYQKMATTLEYATDSAPLVEVFRLGRKKVGAKYDPLLLIKFQNPFERQRFYDKYSMMESKLIKEFIFPKT